MTPATRLLYGWSLVFKAPSFSNTTTEPGSIPSARDESNSSAQSAPVRIMSPAVMVAAVAFPETVQLPLMLTSPTNLPAGLPDALGPAVMAAAVTFPETVQLPVTLTSPTNSPARLPDPLVP
jgi:hypothetical protein